MKKTIPAIIAAAMLLICGCAGNRQESDMPVKEPKLLISDLTAETGSIQLTILAIDGDLKAYDRWGIVYGETSDKSQGQEILAENSLKSLIVLNLTRNGLLSTTGETRRS